jgi:hypothetical protein
MGWVALNADEATAQVFYGYQPVGGANRVYAPVTPYGYSIAPSWFGGGYQLPGWSNISACTVGYPGAVGYPGGNRQFPLYSYPAGNRPVPASKQPVVPGAGFFSIDDPYQQQPSSGSTPPNLPGRYAPAFRSPFYNDLGIIAPANGFFPANTSGRIETLPGFAVPVRPAAPPPATDSPFYR